MVQRYMVTMTHAFPDENGKWVRADECEREIAALRATLQELVTLKEMKDRGLDYDDRIEYMDRKPKAWAAAKELLTPNGLMSRPADDA